MISFEELERYLPRYLSDTSQNNLFEELKIFPENIDQRIYSSHLTTEAIIYQGDGLNGLMVVNLPHPEIKLLPALVLSNTCDIDPSNKRFFPMRIVYAPIFKLEKYRLTLVNAGVESKTITSHIETIKKQFISHILYLPRGCGLEHDSIVFLDRLNNCPVEDMTEEYVKRKKLFTLSDYGFYLFLIKLSIHFTRIRESVNRTLDETG